MSQLDDFTINLLTNDEVLAINQDAFAKPAKKVFDKNHLQVWTKELEDGTTAIGIFNQDDKTNKQNIDFASIKLSPKLKFRDIWRQKELGIFSNSYAASLPSHGVILLKARTPN